MSRLPNITDTKKRTEVIWKTLRAIIDKTL